MLKLRLYTQCSYLLEKGKETNFEAQFPEAITQDQCHRIRLIRKTVAPALDANKLTLLQQLLLPELMPLLY